MAGKTLSIVIHHISEAMEENNCEMEDIYDHSDDFGGFNSMCKMEKQNSLIISAAKCASEIDVHLNQQNNLMRSFNRKTNPKSILKVASKRDNSKALEPSVTISLGEKGDTKIQQEMELPDHQAELIQLRADFLEKETYYENKIALMKNEHEDLKQKMETYETEVSFLRQANEELEAIAIMKEGVKINKLCGGCFKSSSHKVKIKLVEIKTADYTDFQLQWKSGPAKCWKTSASK